MPTKQLTPAEALSRAQDLCAASEHCEADIRTKLYRWGIDSTNADAIIDALYKELFIDETRFAEACVREKFNNAHWGRRKILAWLSAKNISRTTAEYAIANECDEERYRSILLKILVTKARDMQRPLSRPDKMRLLQFAVGRGYEVNIAIETISDINKSDD